MLAPLNIKPLLSASLIPLFQNVVSWSCIRVSEQSYDSKQEELFPDFTDAEVEAELMSNDLPKVNW